VAADARAHHAWCHDFGTVIHSSRNRFTRAGWGVM
jgi:hypothetical protein